MNDRHSPLLVLAAARPDAARSQITLGRLVVIIIIIIRTKTLKASRGSGVGSGEVRGVGEHRKLTSAGSGAEPRPQTLFFNFSHEITFGHNYFHIRPILNDRNIKK